MSLDKSVVVAGAALLLVSSTCAFAQAPYPVRPLFGGPPGYRAGVHRYMVLHRHRFNSIRSVEEGRSSGQGSGPGGGNPNTN